MKTTFEKEFFLKVCCYSHKKIKLAWNMKKNPNKTVTLQDFLEVPPIPGNDKLHFVMYATRLTESQKAKLWSLIEQDLKKANINLVKQDDHQHIFDAVRDNKNTAKIVFDTVLTFSNTH